MTNKLPIAGFSPYDIANISKPLYPFEGLFDGARNLKALNDIKHVDLVMLWGGDDIPPRMYKQKVYGANNFNEPSERDLFEWHLLHEAYNEGIPVLGICRGAQILCAFNGGKLVQHITGHESGHSITTYDGSVLHGPAHHHQQMYPHNLPKDEFDILAFSYRQSFNDNYKTPDKEMEKIVNKLNYQDPECVYFPKTKMLGIQWHPEWQQYYTPERSWVLNQIQTRLLDV